MKMKIIITSFILSLLIRSGVVWAQDFQNLSYAEQAVAKAAEFNKRMQLQIQKYQNADAKKDAEAAFNNNDLRFISIMGYAPGIDGEYSIIEEYGTFSMPDTGDLIVSQKHGEFQEVARDYAARYNKAMLSLIKRAIKEPLILTIKSDKQVYQAGEDVRLSASLENKSSKEIIVYWNNDTPVLGSDKAGVFVASMPVVRVRDLEILHIKPRGSVQKNVFVKSDRLSGDLKLALQYNPMELKIDQKIFPQQELFKRTLVSNLIALRIDERTPDILDAECMRALSLGANYISSSGLTPGDYKLIKAENMLTSGSYYGSHIWHLTYKAKDLIDRSGKGGEVFIEVDMKKQEARLSGYGE